MQSLDDVPLWRGEHALVKQLVEDFGRCLYLPRLAGPEVLIRAIRDGVALLTWQSDTFACAESYDEAAHRYRGLRAGQMISVSAESSALLVRARSVHGALLALMLIVAYGFSEFVLRRGFQRPLIRAGTIAYGAGVIVMLGAAMVSGFITTDLTAFTPHATSIDLQINAQLLTLCRVLNQTRAHFGALAMSAGIALWSADLLRGTWAPRLIGVLGALVSLVPAFALMFGVMHLDVPGMTAIVLLQAMWNVAVAVGMMRSRI